MTASAKSRDPRARSTNDRRTPSPSHRRAGTSRAPLRSFPFRRSDRSGWALFGSIAVGAVLLLLVGAVSALPGGPPTLGGAIHLRPSGTSDPVPAAGVQPMDDGEGNDSGGGGWGGNGSGGTGNQTGSTTASNGSSSGEVPSNSTAQLGGNTTNSTNSTLLTGGASGTSGNGIIPAAPTTVGSGFAAAAPVLAGASVGALLFAAGTVRRLAARPTSGTARRLEAGTEQEI